ncbi:MAG: sporulation integral membrane protein YlbJ [Clostridia bacterium]|nr:sporulation integral membrane protein YlbJ [Clostridia bacterium]
MLVVNRPYFTRVYIPIIKTFVFTCICLFMILFPQEIFKASVRGLEAWWSTVVPALLPFFIVSELLLGLGAVHFMGVLLEPVMRPLFNVPGSGAFVVAMGYTSGAPIGALLTAELRKKNLCTRTEAQRLIAFTNNSSPLFLFGAVAVGMFHNPALGSIIALSHYAANLFIGFLFRFWKKNESVGISSSLKGCLIRKAFKALLEAQREDNRPLGTLLADSIKKSVQTLILIGGFIIFFSVFIEILRLVGILKIISRILYLLLTPLKIDPAIIPALSTGTFEVTLGTKIASETGASLPMQLIATSAMLGWQGLSIHAQVASVIKDTDLSMGTFIAARFLHAVIAPFLAVFLLGPIGPTLSSFLPEAGASAVQLFSNWAFIITLSAAFIIILCILTAVFSLVLYILKSIMIFKFHR